MLIINPLDFAPLFPAAQCFSTFTQEAACDRFGGRICKVQSFQAIAEIGKVQAEAAIELHTFSFQKTLYSFHPWLAKGNRKVHCCCVAVFALRFDCHSRNCKIEQIIVEPANIKDISVSKAGVDTLHLKMTLCSKRSLNNILIQSMAKASPLLLLPSQNIQPAQALVLGQK